VKRERGVCRRGESEESESARVREESEDSVRERVRERCKYGFEIIFPLLSSLF